MKEFKKIFSAILSIVMAFGALPLEELVNFKISDIFSITANATEENINPESTNNDINIYHRVYDEISKYGLSNFHWEDEDGNVVELENSENPMLYSQATTYSTLPSYYSSVDEGYVTPVENQSTTGACWAFSSLSTLATYGLKNENVNIENADFSESHLAWFSGTSSTEPNDVLYMENDIYKYNGEPYTVGGSWQKTMSHLSSGKGIAFQSDYPSANSFPTIAEEFRYDHSAGVIKSAERITQKTTNINLIKSSVYSYGAVDVSFYSTDGMKKGNNEYNPDTYAYYNSNDISANHAVSIVGWDDNFSKNNFVNSPSYDGAWLVKNSWGTSFGDEGYFWISYYDTSLQNYVRYSYDPDYTYDNIYQYEGDEFNYSISQDSFSSVEQANVFVSKGNEILKSVGFYTDQNSVSATIYIYKNLSEDYSSPIDGTLSSTIYTTASYEGYHTVELDEEVFLETDEVYSIVIRFRTTGEACIPVNTSENKHYYGNSYINYSVGDNVWEDLSNYVSDSFHVCIKAFTDNIPEPIGEGVSTYTVNYYIKDQNNENYILTSETHTGYTGNIARISKQVNKGLQIDETVSNLSGIITDDNTLVLNIYLTRKKFILYANFGSSFKSKSFYYGAPIDMTYFNKKCYTISWNSDIPETMPAIDLTIYGEYIGNKHYVSWVVEGKTVYKVQYSYGDTIERIEDPTVEHGTFKKWDKTIPSTMPDEDLTFTAEFEWEKYTVTWNWEGGTQTDVVEYGKPLTRPTVPDLDTGYTFYTWDSGVPSAMPASNLTFTAIYTPKKFTAYYYLDDELVQTKTFTVEHSLSFLKPKVTTSTREGYEIIWNEDYKIQPNDIIITGYYSPIEYSINFVAQGETVSSQSFNAETINDFVVEMPVVPQKSGYLNARWSDFSLKLDNITVNALYDKPYTILLQQQLTIKMDETVRMIPTCNYDIIKREWTSSNPSIATVDNRGNITPTCNGECKITVICYGYDDLGDIMKSSSSVKVVVKDKSNAQTFKEKFREWFDDLFEIKLHDFAFNIKDFIYHYLYGRYFG